MQTASVSWKKFERCPYKPREGQACVVSGESVFIFGGVFCYTEEEDSELQNMETNQLLKFDVGQGIWEEIIPSGDIPESRSGSTLAAVGNKLYLFGGLNQKLGWLDDFYSFDISASKWSKLDDLKGHGPSPRDKLSSCTVGASIYFFGGFGPDLVQEDSPHESDEDEWEDIEEIDELEHEQMSAKFTWFSDVYRFDTDSDHWSNLSHRNGDSLRPSPRAAHTMCAFEKELIVFGGRDSVGRQNDIWSFSFNTSKWTQLNPGGCQPLARSFHAAVSNGTRMFVYGGRGITNQHFSDFNIYDIEKNLWIQTSAKGDIVPPAMGMHSLAVVGSDVVLCFGTSNLDPVTTTCSVHYVDCYSTAVENVTTEENGTESENNTQNANDIAMILNLESAKKV